MINTSNMQVNDVNVKQIKPLISPDVLMEQIPLDQDTQKFILSSRAKVDQIINQKQDHSQPETRGESGLSLELSAATKNATLNQDAFLGRTDNSRMPVSG